MDLERRASLVEVRASGRTLYGIAAPFNSRAQIGSFTETITPGAFSKSLAAQTDIRALADHQVDRLLGRTRSGTLSLHETPAGLSYVLTMPDTTLGNDLLTLAQRGDLSGMSIGFHAESEQWPSPSERVLQSIDLREISVISGGSPAYADTTIAVRRKSATGADLNAQHAHGLRLRRALLLVI
jgi:HK97 family phage prohead protease